MACLHAPARMRACAWARLRFGIGMIQSSGQSAEEVSHQLLWSGQGFGDPSGLLDKRRAPSSSSSSSSSLGGGGGGGSGGGGGGSSSSSSSSSIMRMRGLQRLGSARISRKNSDATWPPGLFSAALAAVLGRVMRAPLRRSRGDAHSPASPCCHRGQTERNAVPMPRGCCHGKPKKKRRLSCDAAAGRDEPGNSSEAPFP